MHRCLLVIQILEFCTSCKADAEVSKVFGNITLFFYHTKSYLSNLFWAIKMALNWSNKKKGNDLHHMKVENAGMPQDKEAEKWEYIHVPMSCHEKKGVLIFGLDSWIYFFYNFFNVVYLYDFFFALLKLWIIIFIIIIRVSVIVIV